MKYVFYAVAAGSVVMAVVRFSPRFLLVALVSWGAGVLVAEVTDAARSRAAKRQERVDQAERMKRWEEAEEANKLAAVEETRARQEAGARRRQDLLRWSRPLQSKSVEWLRFEYEKRQRSIQALQTKIARLSREQSELLEETERWRNDDNATNYNPRAFSIGGEISGCEEEVTKAEEEIAVLQQILDTKWS